MSSTVITTSPAPSPKTPLLGLGTGSEYVSPSFRVPESSVETEGIPKFVVFL